MGLIQRCRNGADVCLMVSNRALQGMKQPNLVSFNSKLSGDKTSIIAKMPLASLCQSKLKR